MERSILQEIIDNYDHENAIDFIIKHGNHDLGMWYKGMHKSSFVENLVIDELTQMLENIPENKPEISESSLSELEKLKVERNERVKQRDYFCGQLEIISSNDARKKIAQQIVVLTKEINQIWADINTLESGNPLPKPENKTDFDTIFAGATNGSSLEKIRKNYTSYASKSRKGTRPKEYLNFYLSVVTEAERRINELV